MSDFDLPAVTDEIGRFDVTDLRLALREHYSEDHATLRLLDRIEADFKRLGRRCVEARNDASFYAGILRQEGIDPMAGMP